jgi:hypothetical protein
MKIIDYALVGLAMTEPLTISTIADKNLDNWDCQPLWHCSLNRQNEYILKIDYLIISIKDGIQASVKVTTVFELMLGAPIYLPQTEEDFEVFVLLGQLAMAHARALFAHEVRNTAFADQILPIQTNQFLREQLALDFRALAGN